MADGAGVGGSGYDLEFLSAYHDRGRSPRIAAIDDNPECQAVLASLDRFGTLSRELLARDEAEAEPVDEGWVGSLLANITREVRAGRDIRYPGSDPTTELTITEGAVREAVRAAGDSVPGVLVGSVGLDGDVTVPLGEVRVELKISVVFRQPLDDVTRLVRGAVHSALAANVPLTVTAIDITVDDIHLPHGTTTPEMPS
ncbi:MAG: Asp23/Gls24 family envelope stress response protein [Microbacteriaceae bacterium]